MIRTVRRVLRLYQGFIISLAILLFGLIGVIFAVIPGVQATIALYDRMRTVEEEYNTLSTKLTILTSLQEDDLRDQLVMALSAVPQDKSVPTIFTTLEGLAQQSGIIIDELKLMSPGSLATDSASKQPSNTKSIRASALPFSLAATGSYDQIRAFVSSVNKVKRLFDVSNFEFSIGLLGDSRVSLSLTAFYQPLPKNVGRVDAPIAALTAKETDVLSKLIVYPEFSMPLSEPASRVMIGSARDPFAR